MPKRLDHRHSPVFSRKPSVCVRVFVSLCVCVFDFFLKTLTALDDDSTKMPGI